MNEKISPCSRETWQKEKRTVLKGLGKLLQKMMVEPPVKRCIGYQYIKLGSPGREKNQRGQCLQVPGVYGDSEADQPQAL